MIATSPQTEKIRLHETNGVWGFREVVFSRLWAGGSALREASGNRRLF
jgi:hypothetical protein